MITKHATRIPNNETELSSDLHSLSISIAGLTEMISSDFGKEMLNRIKSKKFLNECDIDGDAVKISGTKEDVVSAENYIKFLIEN